MFKVLLKTSGGSIYFNVSLKTLGRDDGNNFNVIIG